MVKQCMTKCEGHHFFQAIGRFDTNV